MKRSLLLGLAGLAMAAASLIWVAPNIGFGWGAHSTACACGID